MSVPPSPSSASQLQGTFLTILILDLQGGGGPWTVDAPMVIGHEAAGYRLQANLNFNFVELQPFDLCPAFCYGPEVVAAH